MSDFDDLFDKKYAERMRQQTERDFSETDWPVLSGRLDAADRRRHRAIPFWWLSLLGGLLLLSNMVWLFKFSTIKKEVESFGQQNTARHDTVFQTIVERHVDTVFQKMAQYLPSAKPGFYPKNEPQKKGDALGTATETELLAELDKRFPKPLAHFIEQNEGQKNGLPKENERAGDENHAADLAKKIAGRPLFELPKIGQRRPYPEFFERKPLILLTKPNGNEHLAQTNPLEKKPGFFKNDWWMTSYSGGWLIPISDDLTRRNGYSAGAEVEYGFTHNHSIWLSLSQTGLTCAGNKTDDYGIDLPYRYDYQVAYFETRNGPKKSNRLGMGGRFRQNGGQKWGRLGFGLGYVLEYQEAFDIFIDWENLIDPQLRQQNLLQVPKEGYAIGYLHGDVGIEWRLGQSWLASVNIWKEAKGHFKHGMPGYFGAKAGLGYKF